MWAGALQYLLRARQWSVANGAPAITSADEVDPRIRAPAAAGCRTSPTCLATCCGLSGSCCAQQSLCLLSLLKPDVPLATLLPHLGRPLRGKDPVPRLSVVVLPKATTRVGRLSAGDKAMLLQSQHRWTGGTTIHSEDLPWLLADWLARHVPSSQRRRGGLCADEARECHSWARNGVDCETS